MSYRDRDWEDEPRSRRGRHSAPDSWVAGDETYAGQPRREPYRDPYRRDPLGDSSTDLGRSTRASRHPHEPPTDSRGWSVPDRLDDTGAWTRGAHTGEWQRPEDDWATPPASSPPDDYTADTADTWRAPTGYGRRRAPEPTEYERPALPSAEPSPAAPTSSGAYVGEVLPRGYGGPRPDPDDRYDGPRSYRGERYAAEPGREGSGRDEPTGYRDEPRRIRDEPAGYGEPPPRRRRPTYREDPPESAGAQAAAPGYPNRPAWQSAGERDAPRRRRPTYREDDSSGYPEPAAPGYREPPRYRDEPPRYRDEPASYRDQPGGYRDEPAPRYREPEPRSYREQAAPTYREQDAPSYREQAAPTYRDQPGPAYREPAAPAYRERPQYPEPRAPRPPEQPASYRAPEQPASYRAPEQPASYRAPEQPASYRTPDGPTDYRGRAAAYRDDQPTAVFERAAYLDGVDRGGQAAYRAGVSDYRQREGEHPERRRAEAGASPYPEPSRRRPAAARAQRRVTNYDVDEDDEVDDEPVPGGYLASAVYTIMWFAVPAVAWVLWSLTLSGQASANCVDDAGVPCASERTEALSTLTDNLPRMLGTLVFSVLIALLLRRVSSSWKAATVGFAAAVVGGGLATVGISVITGQPIG